MIGITGADHPALNCGPPHLVDHIQLNWLIDMDVFLEQTPDWMCQPVVSCIGVSHQLKANSAETLMAEANQLRTAGVRFVSVRRQQILQIGEEILQDVLSDSGLSVSCVGYAGGFTGTLGMSYDDSLRDTQRAIDAAANLDARYLVMLPGNQGLHTYNHAERSIRMGMTNALYHARRRQIRLLLPTATLLGNQRDYFRPRLSPLTWVDHMMSRWIRPLIVVRGNRCRLPEGWKQSLADGGCLRLCHRCNSYERNRRILDRLLTFLANRPTSSRRQPISAE